MKQSEMAMHARCNFILLWLQAFLDDQVEDLDSSLLAGADYSLCLDSLADGGSSASSDLFLHVSKPPREGSRAFALLSALNQVAGLAVSLSLYVYCIHYIQTNVYSNKHNTKLARQDF